VDDGHPALQPAAQHGSVQELGPALIGVEEDKGCRRPRGRDGQTGKSTARAQVEQTGRPRVRWGGLSLRQLGESGGVEEVGLNGPGAEKTGGAGL
jgi:hypothetical protein